MAVYKANIQFMDITTDEVEALFMLDVSNGPPQPRPLKEKHITHT
jgi:hypothetical protein